MSYEAIGYEARKECIGKILTDKSDEIRKEELNLFQNLAHRYVEESKKS